MAQPIKCKSEENKKKKKEGVSECHFEMGRVQALLEDSKPSLDRLLVAVV
jgi:hypothetical protein